VRLSRRFFLPLVLALTGLAMFAGAVVSATGAGRTVEVGIKYSRFEPEHFRFEAGQVVTFVISNSDPIDHEFIVGDQSVQDRHETGTEPYHDAIPTEVTVPAGETVRTTIAFGEPGHLLIGCHLPGHYAYGMKGTITVR